MCTNIYRRASTSWKASTSSSQYWRAPMCANMYWRASASWKVSTLPSQCWTQASMTSFVKYRISQHRWKALPKQDFFCFFCSQCPIEPLVNKGDVDKDDILSAFLLWPFIQEKYEQIRRKGQPFSERDSLRLNCIWKRDKCGLTFFFSGELFCSEVVLYDIWCEVSKVIEWPKGYIDEGRGLDGIQGA